MGLGRRNARHVDLTGNKCGYRGVEIISQGNVDVADVFFRAFLRRPLCEAFQKLFDGHEQPSDGRFDGRLDQREKVSFEHASVEVGSHSRCNDIREPGISPPN